MLKPSKRNKKQKVNALNFELTPIYPKTNNQQKVFDLYDEGKNLFLYGCPGTGKTLCPIYLGLRDMLEYGTYEKIVLIRNNETTKECGFLPGDVKQKFEVFERAFKGQINFLFNRDDAWEILEKKNILQFENTSFLRGITYSNCLIIADECQNYSMAEFSTIVTRLDETSRIVFCGDYGQTDLNLKKDPSGFNDFLKIVNLMDEFSTVEFTVDDIVRSDLVKSFILAKIKLGL